MDRANSSSSIGSALRKVESFQYPATHLGHLSDSQVDALQAFKKLAASKGYYKSDTPDSEPSHDDETMLRYLRARKFSPPEAFKQFKETEDWRRAEKIDELYETIDVHEYDETRRLYPQWTGRRDKRGIPVYVFEVAHLTSKRMAAYDKSVASATTSGKTSPKLIRLFALYENLLRFAMPLCSGIPDRPYPETPVSQSNNIVDISGVGLKQFWNLRQHMQDASQLATAHYPETLDRIFVIGAPSFFPTVWSWIKGWFDPITVSKIFILSRENVKKTLQTYIDPANIPAKYGGTLNWEWGSLPALEPAIDKALTWENPEKTAAGGNSFPPGPIKWVRDHDGHLLAIAVGSEKGKPRKEVIARLPVADNLSLGALSAQLSKISTTTNNNNLAVQENPTDPMFGNPSTSGTHTHPTSEEYFPSTGMTPPDEPEEPILGQSSTSGDSQAAGGVLDGPYKPPTRQGTSATRYEEQAATHADGQMLEGTPDHVGPDKAALMEPSTVGQARKNVDVPNATNSDDAQPQPGYLEQAQTAAVGAASAVSGLGSAVMAKVGLGAAQDKTEESTPSTSASVTDSKPEDSRVDKMDDKAVEEFLRGQHATSNSKGKGPVDEAEEKANVTAV